MTYNIIKKLPLMASAMPQFVIIYLIFKASPNL